MYNLIGVLITLVSTVGLMLFFDEMIYKNEKKQKKASKNRQSMEDAAQQYFIDTVRKKMTL